MNKAGYEMMVLAGRMIQEVVHQPANASDIAPFFCVLSLVTSEGLTLRPTHGGHPATEDLGISGNKSEDTVGGTRPSLYG